MGMQDPIADMLTRLRNGQMIGLDTVKMPLSKLKASIAEVLKLEGYISDYQATNADAKGTLTVSLKYHQGKPVIEKIRRVSRPGLRVYKTSKDLTRVRNGFGVAIVSTPKGVMADRLAKASGQGGEILCEVY